MLAKINFVAYWAITGKQTGLRAHGPLLATHYDTCFSIECTQLPANLCILQYISPIATQTSHRTTTQLI